MPSNRCDSAPANAATRQAPSSPASTPPPISRPRRHHARHRKHDADDQAGLEDFTENNEQRGEHGGPLTPPRARRSGLRVEVVEEIVAARLLSTDVDRGLAVAGNDLLDLQGLALELHRGGVEIMSRVSTIGAFAGALISAGSNFLSL